jgi:hypothetical protein
MPQFQHPGLAVASQKSIPVRHSTFERSTFVEMPRPFLLTLLVFSSLAILSGCASTTTTTVGVTTNEAPPFHDVGR